MMKMSQKQQTVVSIILQNGPASSSEIHKEFINRGDDVALVTVKRLLSDLASAGALTIIGTGPATSYEVSAMGRLFATVDTHAYCAVDPDKRYGLDRFNFDLFRAMPSDVFSESELVALRKATSNYEERTNNVSVTIQKKELERLVIELSWKSSKIEGNTYTLLDTEKLILENKEAPGHDKSEARMILNHKEAFTFIHENKSLFQTLTRANLEQLHAVLVKDLNVHLGFRQKPVGVVGSKYRPLENVHQISEAVDAMTESVSKATLSYTKALIAILGISYIQPFEDGNKRTSRLMANALLLSHGCAPLSYRSVDENEYREAMLVFYEINSLIPLKKIFVSQYEFSSGNYAVK